MKKQKWRFAAVTSIIFLFSFQNCLAFKVALIADIHAGSEGKRNYSQYTSGNIIYPSNFEKNLKTALAGIKKKSPDLIIDLGDVSNDESVEYTKKVKKIYAQSGIKVAYVKGNHDSAASFRKLSSKKYYYIDKSGWRIVVLDTSASKGTYIDNDQIEWFKKVIDKKKKVLVAMHTPVWQKDNSRKVDNNFAALKKIFANSDNVKYVVSGHFHSKDWKKVQDGVTYRTIPALSLERRQGYYQIINL